MFALFANKTLWIDDHSEEYEKYKQETTIGSSSTLKRPRLANEAANSPAKPSTSISSQFSHATRYGPNSLMQKERTTALIHFLIKFLICFIIYEFESNFFSNMIL